MSNYETGFGTTDPSLTAGSVIDNPFPGVPAEIVEVLGEDTVAEVEAVSEELRILEELSKTPDPFLIDRPSEIDLSSLDPEVRNVIENYESLRTLRSVKRMKENLIVIKLLKASFAGRRVTTEVRWVDNATRRNKSTQQVLGILEEDLSRDQSRADPHYVKPSDRIKARLAQLNAGAQKLPSSSTMQTLKNFGLLSIDEIKFVERRDVMALLPLPRMLKKDLSYKQKGAEKIEVVAAEVEETRRWGKALHKDIVELTKSSEETVVLELLESLAAIQRSLPSVFEETPDLALVSEQYLEEKTLVIEKHLRRTSARSLNEPAVRASINRLRGRPLAQSLEANLVKEKAESASGFNKQITEARDILRGGTRLDVTKELPNPRALGTDLHNLATDAQQKTRLLTPEESGLIMAIIGRRFASFLEVLQKINEGENDENLNTIAAQRPDVIKELQRFELDRCIESLLDKLFDKNQRNQFASVLSEASLSKIEIALSHYLNPPESNASNGNGESETSNTEEPQLSPTRVEEILTPAELIGELDWTVLPYGEEGEQELEEAAHEIVEEAKQRAARGEDIELDLNRLNILKNVRKSWGTDRCHYERGSLRNRGKVIVDGEGRPDEYIVLVLQHLDPSGSVVMEHAIAESPIARHNALYVFRADAERSTGFSWREVFSVPKKDAREIGGARPLKHTKGDGRPIVEFLTDRVKLLLTCPAENFHNLRFQGPSTWLSRKIGEVASQ